MSKPVICSACGEHVYDIDAKAGDVRRAADLTPAHPDVVAPREGDEVTCPLCGSHSFLGDIDRAVMSP